MPGETMRSVLSLALFIHLFIVALCLSASYTPSSLQQRLGSIFRPYTELLHLRIQGEALYLTHATQLDVDHRLEVLPAGADPAVTDSWQSIARGSRGGERYTRYQRLADAMAYFQEDEEVTATIAAGVARNYAAQGEPIDQIRCRQHKLQSWDAIDSTVAGVRDPNDPMYFADIYEANVLTIAPDRIRIVKRSDPALESAPTRGGDLSGVSGEGLD